MSESRIEILKQTYNLIPHPEGGFFSEVYRSHQKVTSPVIHKSRDALSHIYFLLTKGDISRWHKVLHDEIWHIYEGDALRIMSFDPSVTQPKIKDTLIGDKSSNGLNHFFHVIEGGHFQCAESTGDYTFMGCCVAPGFDFCDFSYIEDTSLKKWLEIKEHDYARFL